MINIIGLGNGEIDFLTVGTLRTLENSGRIFLKTHNNEIIDYLKSKNIDYKSYNDSFINIENKGDTNNKIAEDIISNEKSFGNVVYGVVGYPLVSERSVENLIEICKENNINYNIIDSYGFIDKIIGILRINPMNGVSFIDSFNIKNKLLDKRVGNLIFNAYNQERIKDVKDRLSNFYNENTNITIMNDLINKEGSIINIKLKDLNLIKDLNYNRVIYVKKDEENKKDFNDLIELVETLMGDNGCPWDMEQTNDSIKNDTLEEVYELIEAINNKDIDNMIEELGDVLFHVVFHASIGKKENNFNISDVLDRIINKMIFRHPHVFGEDKVNTSRDVLVKWDELKKEEKQYKTITEEMQKVAKTLPSLTKANKVQKKAAKVGFDFDNLEDASKKVIEELNEVLEIYGTGDKEKIYSEVGDLIFSCVNVSRILRVNEEEALNLTIQKFINRFSLIENEALSLNKRLNDMTLKEMDDIWNKAKMKEKK